MTQRAGGWALSTSVAFALLSAAGCSGSAEPTEQQTTPAGTTPPTATSPAPTASPTASATASEPSVTATATATRTAEPSESDTQGPTSTESPSLAPTQGTQTQATPTGGEPTATPTAPPTAAATRSQTPTRSTPAFEDGPCASIGQEDFINVYIKEQATIRYAVAGGDGRCVGVQYDNNGMAKSAWAIQMTLAATATELTHFEGGSVSWAGNRMEIQPNVGEWMPTLGTANFCYCSDAPYAYPVTTTYQWEPANGPAYQGLPINQGTWAPGTLYDSATGLHLEFTTATSVRGALPGGCAELLLTNHGNSPLSVSTVDLQLSGAGVEPRFWPDWVSLTQGGSQIHMALPASYMPMAPLETLPVTLCMGNVRMPYSMSVTTP